VEHREQVVLVSGASVHWSITAIEDSEMGIIGRHMRVELVALLVVLPGTRAIIIETRRPRQAVEPEIRN
jgi:hypothetical protein